MDTFTTTYLVGAAVERALGVDTVLEVVRVVLTPVPAQDVVEAGTERFVLPTLDASTLVVTWNVINCKALCRAKSLPST